MSELAWIAIVLPATFLAGAAAGRALQRRRLRRMARGSRSAYVIDTEPERRGRRKPAE